MSGLENIETRSTLPIALVKGCHLRNANDLPNDGVMTKWLSLEKVIGRDGWHLCFLCAVMSWSYWHSMRRNGSDEMRVRIDILTFVFVFET